MVKSNQSLHWPHILFVHGELSRWMVGAGELYYTDGDQERVREEKIGQQRGGERESVCE